VIKGYLAAGPASCFKAGFKIRKHRELPPCLPHVPELCHPTIKQHGRQNNCGTSSTMPPYSNITAMTGKNCTTKGRRAKKGNVEIPLAMSIKNAR
jgi:hypothetical protein